MPNEESQDLPAIYEDYLGTLDAAEIARARSSLQRWNRFLEGRAPGAVDGNRREWFEMAQEEEGLPSDQIRDVSERVGRFYDWLSLARPGEAKAGTRAARPAPTVDPALPPPPASLQSDPNLWKQGPSVGSPPAAAGTRRRSGPPLKTTIESGAVRPRRWYTSPIFLGGALFVIPVFLVLPYLFVWGPRAQMEQDLAGYLASADAPAMDKLWVWFIPKAQKRGLEPQLEKIQVEKIALGKTIVTERIRYRVRLIIPVTQHVMGVRLESRLTAEGTSEFEIPSPPLPKEEARALPAPLPQVHVPAASLSKEDAAFLLESISAVRTMIDNYRRTYPGVPVRASQFLAEELQGVQSQLEVRALHSKAQEELEEVISKLLVLSKQPPELSSLENILFPLETLLRQAERHARQEGPAAANP